ncbi:MAG TPA: hypothetical protein PLJ98_00915 [Acholeplasmataceae bacterium]|nr:hypothetical protein [Acholeplasmataceae bacterium]
MKKKHLSVDDTYSLDDLLIHEGNPLRLEDDPPINTKRLIRAIFFVYMFPPLASILIFVMNLIKIDRWIVSIVIGIKLIFFVGLFIWLKKNQNMIETIKESDSF